MDQSSLLLILVMCIIMIGACIGLAFIPACIAAKKGYSKGGFWVFGFFIFLPALIVALALPPRLSKVVSEIAKTVPFAGGASPDLKYCADCGTACPKSASFCTKCGRRF